MNATPTSKKGWQTCACGCGRSFRILANQTTGRRRLFFSAGCRVKVSRANHQAAAASMPSPATIPSGPLVMAANDQRSARPETAAPGAAQIHAGRPVQVNTHTTGSTKNFGRIVRSQAATHIWIAEDTLTQEGGK